MFVKMNNFEKRDLLAGLLMMIVGLGASYGGSTYQIGTLAQMGAGFFPTALGILLFGVGVLLVLSSHQSSTDVHGQDSEGSQPEPKFTISSFSGVATIVLGVVAFQLSGKYFGLLPATFAIVFICAIGRKDNSLRDALFLAAAMMAVSAGLFHWALQLPLPLFQSPF